MTGPMTGPLAEQGYEPAPAPMRTNPFKPLNAPQMSVRPAQLVEERMAPQPPAPAPTPAISAGRSLFGMMTRSMRRSPQVEPTEPQRAEPSFLPDAAPVPQPNPYGNSDEALEIPAFLRRQNQN